MCLSYLVEIFFGHLKIQDFFVLQKFFKTKSIFRSIFRDVTGSLESSSSKAVLSAHR
jgi:hypothetical protein